MLKEDVDSLLSSMIESFEGVSDLFFVVGKPPQVEAYGKLKPYPDDSPAAILSPNKVEDLAVYLMNGIERLQRDFLSLGACDCSYGIEGFARFRVNVSAKMAITPSSCGSSTPSSPPSISWVSNPSSGR